MKNENCIGTMPEMRLSSSEAINLSWRVWLADGKRLIVAECAYARSTVRAWRARARSRSDLAHLDARLLTDIGVTRRQAQRETRKPFWKA